MSNETAAARAEEFLAISGQFRLGNLVTESSHPVTANLSDVVKRDTAEALDVLFQVDEDVITKYAEWAASGKPQEMADTVLSSLLSGGRIFFTGCGATGRLSILLDEMWRQYWQQMKKIRVKCESLLDEWENRTFSLMAGGDFALIKAVEGFEDITEFGKRQMEELGVREGDVTFAITEGGETSWVIGTAWKALEKGAKVYFVYNNPDDVLRERVQRSREIIDEPRIEKINLTTGPMAITGSTRMQATTIQLCVLSTVLEMALRKLANRLDCNLVKLESDDIPQRFLDALKQMLATLRSEPVRKQLAALVEMEVSVYKSGHRNNYFADGLGIDVLTDTTERSPTFCIPPFRKFDDPDAAESWSFLYLPSETTPEAWKQLLKRDLRAVEWTEKQVREMVGPEDAPRRYEVMRRISKADILKFRIGQDGLPLRILGPGDSATAIADSVPSFVSVMDKNGFFRKQLKSARKSGARTGFIFFGSDQLIDLVEKSDIDALKVLVPVPETDFRLNGILRVGAKMLLNALSTCTMVRLGRVMGNYMIYVVASNLKLIDRATRYIQRLTDLSYEDACHLLFEVIEYVEPRMKSDQAYPPVVGVAVLRAKQGLSNEEAEAELAKNG